ncbi:hypothetical protein BDV59DRAFT_204781 [Aspergillus ambiguus]|uniref:uncharacterized protein n=1 Tax=Aspergillus ambiguus TaxID=176160 RepID=UPI003CCCA190
MSLPPRLFASLVHPSRSWSLARSLHSDNPLDLHGDLVGTSSFTPLPATSSTTDLLYQEEGEMPRPPGLPNNITVGLRFTKKYIWRLNDAGRISVWFAKVGADHEPDYLFHEFDFDVPGKGSDDATWVTPPNPPAVTTADDDSLVVTAHGNHLCINDMYRTAYSFRVRPSDGTVLSWASRHVVKGPKKNQDIVNLYSPL